MSAPVFFNFKIKKKLSTCQVTIVPRVNLWLLFPFVQCNPYIRYFFFQFSLYIRYFYSI